MAWFLPAGRRPGPGGAGQPARSTPHGVDIIERDVIRRFPPTAIHGRPRQGRERPLRLTPVGLAPWANILRRFAALERNRWGPGIHERTCHRTLRRREHHRSPFTFGEYIMGLVPKRVPDGALNPPPEGCEYNCQTPSAGGRLDELCSAKRITPCPRFPFVPGRVATPKGFKLGSRGQRHALCARRPYSSPLPWG